MKKFLFNYVLPPLFFLVLRLLGLTLFPRNLSPEVETEIRGLDGPIILALWHSRILFLCFYPKWIKENDLTVLVSPSVDGDLIARICELMGCKTARASSFKNTFRGSRDILKALKSNAAIAIIADGSRGPRHQAQAGLIQMARSTGAPVYGLTYDASRKIEFNSWDRFLLPLPFARCPLKMTSAIKVPEDADGPQIKEKQQELTRALCQKTDECTAALNA